MDRLFWDAVERYLRGSLEDATVRLQYRLQAKSGDVSDVHATKVAERFTSAHDRNLSRKTLTRSSVSSNRRHPNSLLTQWNTATYTR